MKDIPGYEGLYSINKSGQIWSYVSNRFLKERGSGRKYLKKIKDCKRDYRTIVLSKNGVPCYFYIHRLVAQIFIENPDSKPQVNHIDANKRNNNVENLEWCTSMENIEHSKKNKLNPRGQQIIQSKLTEKDVLNIRRHLEDKMSQYKIAKDYGVKQSTISLIKLRKSWGWLK